MMGRVIPIALLCCASVCGQQQTAQRTPWHKSVVVTYERETPPGHTSGIGEDIARLPSGYNGVVEQISARCVAPATLPLVYGEVTASSNPTNPGQSGMAGAAGQADSANHSLLFQTAFSGSPRVYVASQRVSMRVASPYTRITFNVFFTSESSQPASATCLVSISGYVERQ